MILAGLAGWQAKVALDNERAAIEQRNIAEQQRRLAQEQRDRAERTLAAATKTANSLLFELAREFRDRAGMPRDLVRRILDRAQSLQRQLADSGETTPALRRSEAAVLTELVDTLLALGDTAQALATAQRARAISDELAGADPGNTGWQRDLSINHDRIGDVLMAAGRREEALAAYRMSLAIRETLAAADPGNAEWQRDLSVSHDRIGDVLMAAGRRRRRWRRTAGASRSARARRRRSRQHRMAALSVDQPCQDWRRADGGGRGRRRSRHTARASRSLRHSPPPIPAIREWQRDLVVGHGRIGNVLAQRGSGRGAGGVSQGLAISETLAATDPGNTGWQRDLSVSHDKVGDVLVDSGATGGGAGGISHGPRDQRELAAPIQPTPDGSGISRESYDRSATC